MLTAGIPMVQAFEIIGVGHDKPAMQKLVLAIKSDIETGNALNVVAGEAPALLRRPVHQPRRGR